LSPGTEAWWDRESKHATCLTCAEGLVADVAGASAAAEGERRVARRVERVNARYGPAAAAVAEHMAEREVSASWGKGSDGESRLAAFIDRELGNAVIALHDRQVPGTRGNIDHTFVARSGVWVVDAKAYNGRVERRDPGSLLRPRNTLYVAGRNRTALTKGVDKQVECVLTALRLEPKVKGTPVHGALCLVGADWGLLDFPFQVGGGAVWVLYPGALRKRLKKKGPLTVDRMKLAAEALDRALPPARG
jgi:Nuclease-related domain